MFYHQRKKKANEIEKLASSFYQFLSGNARQINISICYDISQLNNQKISLRIIVKAVEIVETVSREVE